MKILPLIALTVGLSPASEPLVAQVGLVSVSSGFSSPIGITGAGDGSGRLFIIEQAGVVRIWDGAAVLAQPFLDISELVDDVGNEQGLLGLAFHPNYSSNGLLFVNYTYDPGSGNDRTRIARYRTSQIDTNVADSASAETILEIDQPFGNHNGGDLHFGPDGYLYIGMGDGGGADDPLDKAQNRTSLLGKMLRIDVDRSGNGQCGLEANYGIPPDNPYVGTNGCDEIWGYGLRNPWRWSFDRETGDLFIGDVGQNEREEIDFQPASSTGGENYEWNCREGSIAFSGNCMGPGTRTPPILDYDHDSGCSVTGGYRYRGLDPGRWGTYIYGDFCSGIIWFANDDQGFWQTTVWRDTDLLITTFGEDDDGEIYLADRAGMIYRIESSEKMSSDAFSVSSDGSAWSKRAYFSASGGFNTGRGADLAERIDTTEPLEASDLVEIDPQAPGRYRKTRGPDSGLAIGVVASVPAIRLSNRPPGAEEDRRPLLALMGRVPVKATTENGPIRIGDLLVSSSTSGSVMRCALPDDCDGKLVGKALEALQGGDGVIEMLLMR